MKICVISTSVFAVHPPCGTAGYSGLEVIAYETARGLAERGHEVTLVAPEGSSCPGATLIPSGPPGTWDEKKAYSQYWPKLLDHEVVIDHTWNKWSYVLKAEGKLKAPVLGVLHAPADTMYAELPPNVDRPCFVCISQDQANHFEALHSVPARVCHNGIDPDFYRPLGCPRSRRFLFLARFSTIKGPDLAIEACRRAGVGLDLVGDTSITQEPEYLAKCRALCDGEQIRMVGPCSRGETVWWFSQAHCLLHPNKLFREPFGLAPVEAQSCGCPVIAWDMGAMRETVEPNRTGWLVRSLDELTEQVKIMGNMTNDCEWEATGGREHCREWASRFSLKNMVARYSELCKEALETGGW